MNLFELDDSLRGPNKSIAEGTENKGWYVLDPRNRKIIANDVSKEQASAIAKAGTGYSIWQTENGTFINATRSVRYPGLGWIDVSEGLIEGQFNSKQEVIDYFVSKGKSAAAGAGAWERGWRGTAPKKKTPTGPVRSYHNDLDDKRYKSADEDIGAATDRRQLESSSPHVGSTKTKQTRGNDEKIAGRYDPEDFDAMVQRVGQKAKEQQKRHPVDIADLARRMKASKIK